MKRKASSQQTRTVPWLEKSTYELGEAFENAAAWAAGRRVKLVNPEVLGKMGREGRR